MKSIFRALSLSAAVSTALLIAVPAEARILIDALGGEVKIEGALSSEARARVGSGDSYLNQWIQRLEVNAEVNYQDVGMFDTLSFVTVIRPEFDAAYYMGETFGSGTANNSGQPSYMGRAANYSNSPIEQGGFDVYQNTTFNAVTRGNPTGLGLNVTGGLGKIVSQGYQDQSWISNNLESIAFRSPDRSVYHPGSAKGAFPLTGVTSNKLYGNAPGQGLLPFNCIRCSDQNVDALDVAMNNTDASGRLYPFRELYMDATLGDWWIRIGKQQVVWGKTDFFRLQDVVNPVDYGQHLFFDSFEDIRIPQWIASFQYKFGAMGPTTDNAVTILWNFDQFQQTGLGNPSQGWAHPFAKDTSVFAMYNTYFAAEPCVNGATELARSQAATALGTAGAAFNNDNICGSRGPKDYRSPAGFGSPAGLRINDRPEWAIENTEPGMRWEFRLGEVHTAISYFYGWNDVPAFQFENVNVLNTGFDDFNALGTPGTSGARQNNAKFGKTDCTVSDLTGGVISGHPFAGAGAFLDPNGACPLGSLGFPIQVMKPGDAIQAIADGGSADRAVDDLTGEVSTISDFAKRAIKNKDATLFYRASANALTGGHVKQSYKQSHIPGLSFDYFESYTGVVFRVESSWTLDELVMNTRKADWADTSNVMRWSIGLDRPTWIKWLNKDRTFFLSMQMFDTWYMDHEGDKHTGYLNDEHNFITTFFYIANYLRDTLKPVGFAVWEESSNSFVAGQSLEWFIDNHWSIKGGFNLIWGGTNNFTHDAGPYHAYIVPDATNSVASDGSAWVRRHPYQEGPLGLAHEGLGSMRDNDELFFQLKYQF